uniref:Guanylate cyclase domain-containing protein n=1 Tax=Angiostrongylus cantonensis TaxID=6313 RepID=A0A158PBB3_ANGCA
MADPLKDVLYQRLFSVFSYFADATSSDGLHPSQASFILDEMLRESGRPSTSHGSTFGHDSVTFRELLNLIEVQFTDRSELEPVVERIFERIIGQVIRKQHVVKSIGVRAIGLVCNFVSLCDHSDTTVHKNGFVLFRCFGGNSGGCIPQYRRQQWRSGWCTISPGVIQLWPLDKQINSDIRVTIPLDGDTHIRLAIERPTRSALQDLDHKRSLRHGGRRYDRELSERQQLETEKRRLEFQLEQERLALKDEEIVRGLATRMLEEEKQKSERMERVLLELQSKLGQRLDTVLEVGTVEVIQDDERPDDEQSSEGRSVEIEISENGCGDVELPNGINGIDVDDEEVWRKDDYLIVSTQSI